ncbi:MAG: pilus assembly protein TadG-related protein [Frankia sp.]|nr:pilus assembly protein TadG-related protein [Frankia sp.]
MTRWRRRPRDDGQLTLLVIGFVAIAGLLLAVIVDASAVFLARRNLSSALDGAALAGAQSVDLQRYYAGAAETALPLDETAVAEQVHSYVAAHAPDIALDEVRVANDGTTVVVAGHVVVRLPLAPVLRTRAFTVRAGAAARAPLR